jgi:hypothetical protein
LPEVRDERAAGEPSALDVPELPTEPEEAVDLLEVEVDAGGAEPRRGERRAPSR